MKISILGRPLTKERIFNAFWLWDARQSRGAGLIAQLRFTNISQISEIGVIYLLTDFPKWTFPFFILGYYSFTYFFGLLDERKLKYWQFSNEKDKTYIVNPYERRMEKHALDLKKKLGIYKKEEDIYEKEI